MKKKILIISSLILSQLNFAQNGKQVHFVIDADSVSEGSFVYITGNHPTVGNWKPDFVPLENSGDERWGVTLRFPAGLHLEYKFTLGSWEREALDENDSIPGNSVLDIVNDTTIYVKINSWANREKRKIEGQTTGTVEYYHGLKGKGIKERDVIVWLPPGYYENVNQRYPVLYMHDGQNIFDPKTSSFGTDWQLDEAADTLIIKHLIKPIIIVGIYNTPDRSSEYAANDTGYAYMNFIINDLKSLIDSDYRTLPDRENTATGGSSLAGLISFMLVWKHSEIFSMAACLSPAFKVDRYDIVTPIEKYSGVMKNIKIYIDIGKRGIDTLLQSGVDQMLAALEIKGFSDGSNLYYFKDPEAEHSEKYWARRTWRFLIFMFGNIDSYKLIQ